MEDIATSDLTDALKGKHELLMCCQIGHSLIELTGIDAVLHTASPFHVAVTDPKRDMLDPAIEGTLNVLRATHNAGIKRIVVTSSFVAVFDLATGGPWRDHTFTADDWNPATYEAAVKGDKPGIWVYCASKALAEKAAFAYAKEHPGLQLTTINRKILFAVVPSFLTIDRCSTLHLRAS